MYQCFSARVLLRRRPPPADSASATPRAPEQVDRRFGRLFAHGRIALDELGEHHVDDPEHQRDHAHDDEHADGSSHGFLALRPGHLPQLAPHVDEVLASGVDPSRRTACDRLRLPSSLDSTLSLVSVAGRRGGTRTPNPRIWSPVHYQLCYAPRLLVPAAPCCYSMISATTPAPTVRPPSRIAKRSSLSIAIGVISVTTISMLSPGITISVPSGSSTFPVTSVVRK